MNNEFNVDKIMKDLLKQSSKEVNIECEKQSINRQKSLLLENHILTNEEISQLRFTANSNVDLSKHYNDIRRKKRIDCFVKVDVFGQEDLVKKANDFLDSYIEPED